MRSFIVALLLIGGTALAQEPQVLDKSKQLRELLRTVAKYPPEIRQAIPVVAQHAKLPGELLDAIGDKNKGAVDEALAKYPKDVQAAGKKLATYPEALEIMMSQRAITEMVGKAYAELGPEKLKALGDELRRDSAKEEAAIAAWAKRLRGNRAALQQLLEATHAYVEAGSESPDGQDYGLGCAVTERNQAIVYALPAAPLTTFILVNADALPEIADEMVEHWLRTNGEDDFDLVMAGWWNMIRQHANPEILEPQGRAQRLQGIATIAKKLGEAYPKERPKFEERVKFVRENLASFPDLQKFLRAKPEELPPLKEGEKIPKPVVAAKPPPPTTPAVPPPASPPPAKANTPPPAKSDSTAPPTAPPTAPAWTSSAKKITPPADVATAQPTAEQQVRHAANNQNFYWFQYNNVSPGYVPYNYGYYNNPYFGAYNYRRDGWPNRSLHNAGGLNRPIGGGRRR